MPDRLGQMRDAPNLQGGRRQEGSRRCNFQPRSFSSREGQPIVLKECCNTVTACVCINYCVGRN